MAHYDIGYRKPPKHTQFQKGRSGNPKGRPKGAKGIKVLIKELMTAKVVVRTGAGQQKMTRMQAMLHKLSEKAFAGDLRALQTLLTYYANSIPDEPMPVQGGAINAAEAGEPAGDEHDLAILDALRMMLVSEQGGAA